MPSVVLLSGSPSNWSRSSALLTLVRRRLDDAGLSSQTFSIRDFPAVDLILGRYDSEAFAGVKNALAQASAVVIASPVYKASFTGGLKALLDILPQAGLRGKIVLPLATGGSPGHQLVIDYAFKPVLSALGATDLHQGVYVVDKQITVGEQGELTFLDQDLRKRFDESAERLIQQLRTAIAA